VNPWTIPLYLATAEVIGAIPFRRVVLTGLGGVAALMTISVVRHSTSTDDREEVAAGARP
jgi:hypothetical protein